LIAEAWDAAGLYQVGTFAGDSWKEWNGRFRDDVRSFLKGDRGMARAMAARVFGSPDIYLEQDREPEQSINFITCHDGFTLNDLVSYNVKHNEENREENRDGMDHNLSWNCGVEGPTDDMAVEALRERQMKNFFAITLLSLGVPMLLMGDEIRRTQGGNNNAYCQNNDGNWFDWSLVDKQTSIREFVRRLVTLRIGREAGADNDQLSLREILHRADIHWHGVQPGKPDWSDDSHAFAVTVRGRQGRFLFHLILNAYWEPLKFELPLVGTRTGLWHRLIDTFRPPPEDITHWIDAPIVGEPSYLVQPRSLVAFFAAYAPEQPGEA
jgi:isoamylase